MTVIGLSFFSLSLFLVPSFSIVPPQAECVLCVTVASGLCCVYTVCYGLFQLCTQIEQLEQENQGLKEGGGLLFVNKQYNE